MKNTVYFLTSFTEEEKLIEVLSDFQTTANSYKIEFPLLQAQISNGDDYFLQQREGMLNFYSGLINPDYMEVHSKFLMHLASCVKGYKIEFENQGSITPLINTLIEKMHGLVFSPNMTFYTSDWRIIIDSEGSCDLTDYDVKMSAATFDNNVETDTESSSRKQRTINYLKQKSIPVLESLPTIPSSNQVHYRSEEEVATRILAVAAVAVKGELKSSDIPYQVLEKYAIHPDDVSPWELEFLNNPNPEEQDFTNAIWRYESLNVLLWAAGYIDELYFPSDIVNVATLTEIIRECRDFEEFMLHANMRDMDEILDVLDLTYRLHWACVNARVENQPIPENVNPSVVYERHYALNWLINRYNEDWDNTSTPT
jgi:hypothetical protein